jgi:DNA-binding MarR family transcriptional regulator/GNAT superfamily N-acetyltransferase
VDQIELVRDFNRYYTRRLGVLGDHYLGLSRPWSESRLLFEIGPAGIDVRDLRRRLGLDSGFVSRMLRSLADQGLVAVRPHPQDGRVRVASLTTAGLDARDELDVRARESVGALLGQLTAGQRDRLVAAQEQVRQLLRMATVEISAIPDDSPAARFCLREYAAELDGRFPSGYSASALLRPGELAVTGGEFLVAMEESAPIGCGIWQPLAASGASVASGASGVPGVPVAEIRHVWISQSCRGVGLGRRLLSELESRAGGQGYRTFRLGTHTALPEAAALYRSHGYREIPLYDLEGYNQLAFEKVLP